MAEEIGINLQFRVVESVQRTEHFAAILDCPRFGGLFRHFRSRLKQFSISSSKVFDQKIFKTTLNIGMKSTFHVDVKELSFAVFDILPKTELAR